MNYECTYNSDLDIIEAAAHALATFKKLSALRKEIVELCREHSSADILVDYSDLNAGPVTMNEGRAIASNAFSTKDSIGKRKCAHVATDLQFGFVRGWETLVKLSGMKDLHTMSFTSRDSALEWLKDKS